jgi:hypothetical protein
VGAFVVTEAMDDVESGQVVFGGLLEQRRGELHHTVEAE